MHKVKLSDLHPCIELVREKKRRKLAATQVRALYVHTSRDRLTGGPLRCRFSHRRYPVKPADTSANVVPDVHTSGGVQSLPRFPDARGTY